MTTEPMTVVTVLDRKPRPMGGEYRLIHSTAGYEIAGSGVRLVAEYWAVRFELDGATHGNRFSSYTAARTNFDARGK